jgi:hypothetical protein
MEKQAAAGKSRALSICGIEWAGAHRKACLGAALAANCSCPDPFPEGKGEEQERKSRQAKTMEEAEMPGRCQQPIVAGATPEERDPANWPPQALEALQQVLDRSRVDAGPAVRDTFEHPERRMCATEFVTFWNASRMKAMATVGEARPHIAPVHAEFVNGRLRSTIYENAVRRRDLRANPNVALTTWGPGGATAIVYGRAREIPDSTRETRPGATGKPRRTVALDIEVTRIYAMRARSEPVGG